jgi:phosphoglycolate phosphatase-like HAD superfamily hydrolase
MRGPQLLFWNDGQVRRALLKFVHRVTTEGTSDFVPQPERIAVFDNDGTLWCEKPLPVQMDFLLRRIATQAARHPSLRERQPWKAVWEKDRRWLSGAIAKHYAGDDGDLRIMGEGLFRADAGETIDAFTQKAEQFLRFSSNPLLHRPYIEAAYAPMQELLAFLSANGFIVFIVTGGGRDFVRSVSKTLYGVPPERVIGSGATFEYRRDQGVGNVYHAGCLDIFDDGPGKPARIWDSIGRRPILAAGNSDGDLEMLEFTAGGSRREPLCLLLNHDDGEREVRYSRGAGEVLELARARGWATISMKEDFRTVFFAGNWSVASPAP